MLLVAISINEDWILYEVVVLVVFYSRGQLKQVFLRKSVSFGNIFPKIYRFKMLRRYKITKFNAEWFCIYYCLQAHLTNLVLSYKCTDKNTYKYMYKEIYCKFAYNFLLILFFSFYL